MAQEPIIMIADSKKTGVRSRGNRIQGQAARVIIEDVEDQALEPEQDENYEDAPSAGLDRAVFFNHIKRSLFKGRLKQVQVERIDAVLAELEYAAIDDLGAWAYVLATGHHEAGQWLYYKELGGVDYFTKLYDIQGQRPAKAKELGNVNKGDGARFCGRGPVGITGRNNYRRQSKKLGIDLESSPELAEQADIGARLLVEGMRDGDYRRRLDGRPYKLSDYFDSKRCDYIGARNIVNGGQDKAQLIAHYAQAYYAALELASSSNPDLDPIYYGDGLDEIGIKSDEIGAEAHMMTTTEESESIKKSWLKNPIDWFAGWKTHVIMLVTAGLAAAELFGVVIPEQVYVLLGALGLSTAYRGVTRNKNRPAITVGDTEK